MMIDLSKYAHIIWDWNGTLLDDAWLCVDVMNGMLQERNLPLRTLEEYRELFDFPVRDYYKKLGFNFYREPFDEIGMEFIVRYNRRQDEAHLQPEALETLTHMTTHGLSQSILSAREQNELLTETRSLGVSVFFDRIYGLNDHYAHGKIDVGRKLVIDLGLPTEKLLFIGDTLHDAEVARELSIDCILISNGHQSKERLLQSGVPVIPSLKMLIGLL
ncbi:MAG: HAD hydrolase-like protein [Bacteroidales bacterium]|jgi:phosphoglycolate phosphatase|nr:HAD hydrolase-like protein [Bacteroidales bacterium]